MCTHAAYAVVLNMEHFVFYISCKHKNKLNQILFSLLCQLKMHRGEICAVPWWKGGSCAKWQPSKAGKHTTRRNRQTHIFVEKGTRAARCLGGCGMRRSKGNSISSLPNLTNENMLLQQAKTFPKTAIIINIRMLLAEYGLTLQQGLSIHFFLSLNISWINIETSSPVRRSVRVRSSEPLKSELFSKRTHDTLFRFPRSFPPPPLVFSLLNTRAPFGVTCPGAVLFTQRI